MSLVQALHCSKFFSFALDEWISFNLFQNPGSPRLDWSAIWATACYKLWQCRNQKIYNSGFMLPELLSNEIQLAHGHYSRAIVLQKKVASNVKSMTHVRWARAVENWIKINIDRVVSSNCKAGCRGLIWNAKGGWLKKVFPSTFVPAIPLLLNCGESTKE